MLGEDDSSPFVGMAYFQKSEHVRLRGSFFENQDTVDGCKTLH